MLFMNDFEYKNDRYGSSDSVRHEEERPSGDALVFSIIGLVSGVMSLSLSFFGYGSIFGMLCGAAAIIFSSLSKKKCSRNNGMATAGLVTGIIGTAISLLMMIIMVVIIVLIILFSDKSGMNSYYY